MWYACTESTHLALPAAVVSGACPAHPLAHRTFAWVVGAPLLLRNHSRSPSALALCTSQSHAQIHHTRARVAVIVEWITFVRMFLRRGLGAGRLWRTAHAHPVYASNLPAKHTGVLQHGGSGFEPLGFGLWGRDCAGRYQQEASGAHPRRRVGIPRAGCQPPWRSYCACPSNSAPPCAMPL